MNRNKQIDQTAPEFVGPYKVSCKDSDGYGFDIIIRSANSHRQAIILANQLTKYGATVVGSTAII